ncbi:MAG: hypothetical protein AABY22_31675 [Nanoarchaeota archaeon]
MRPFKRRDKYHFIKHYLSYWLYPNSNHNLLGLENRGGQELFGQLENIRLGFRELLAKRGYNNTSEDVIKLFSNEIDDEIKYYINNHKILNDTFRYYVLKDESVNDNHHWRDIIKYD